MAVGAAAGSRVAAAGAAWSAASRAREQALEVRWIDHLVSALLVYYWVLLYAVPIAGAWAGPRVVYAAFTLPVLLLPVVAASYVVEGAHRAAGAVLVAFGLIAGTAAVVRLDLATARTVTVWVLTLLVLVGARPRVRLRTINRLFLLSIGAGVLTTWTGQNPFGYVPDFTRSTAGGDPGWRISMFPFVPESAFFALVVAVVNFWEGRGATRLVAVALGLYYLAFSGIRSAMICGVFAAAIGVAARRVPLRDILFYRVAGMGLALALILGVSSGAVVAWLAGFEIAWLNHLMFRGEDPRLARIADALARVEIWRQHWLLFLQNPMFGIGTFDFAELNTSAIPTVQVASGAESGFTTWLARVGVPALLLVLFLYVLHLEALYRRAPAAYVMAAVVGATLLTYGTLLVPYNFVFLVMFCVICGSRT